MTSCAIVNYCALALLLFYRMYMPFSDSILFTIAWKASSLLYVYPCVHPSRFWQCWTTFNIIIWFWWNLDRSEKYYKRITKIRNQFFLGPKKGTVWLKNTITYFTWNLGMYMPKNSPNFTIFDQKWPEIIIYCIFWANCGLKPFYISFFRWNMFSREKFQHICFLTCSMWPNSGHFQGVM